MLTSKSIAFVLDLLGSMKERADATFNRFFKETTILGRSLHGEDFELQWPRLQGRQVHRANVSAQSAEEDFRITLHNEFLITELQERFIGANCQITDLLQLLPDECSIRDNDNDLPEYLAHAAQFHSGDMPHPVMLPNEYRM